MHNSVHCVVAAINWKTLSMKLFFTWTKNVFVYTDRSVVIIPFVGITCSFYCGNVCYLTKTKIRQLHFSQHYLCTKLKQSTETNSILLVSVLRSLATVAQFVITYSTSLFFLWQQVGIIFQEVVDSVPYTTGSCKMMFPISYLVYSVNYFTCLLIT